MYLTNMYENIVIITRTIYMMPRSLRLINMPEERDKYSNDLIFFLAFTIFMLFVYVVFCLKPYIRRLVRKIL